MMMMMMMMKNPNTNTQRQTAKGMRQFFEWLEGRFGGPGTLPMDSGAAGEVLTRDALHLDDLQRLVTHQATALHVKNYYPKASAIALGAQLAQQAQQGQARNWKVSTAQGLESSDVFTLGAHAPYNIAVANNQVDEYYEGVQQELQQRRRRRSSHTPTSDADEDRHDDDTNATTTTTANLLWPLDQFRLDLDQVWPQGAGLARHDACPSKCRSGGLTRVTMGPTRWKRGFVHVDELAPLSNTNGFFSANIYLQLPDDDVAAEAQPILEIWPLAVRSKWDWYRVSRVEFSRVQLHGMEWNGMEFFRLVGLAYRFLPLPCLLACFAVFLSIRMRIRCPHYRLKMLKDKSY
jgi:hypothetical protein